MSKVKALNIKRRRVPDRNTYLNEPLPVEKELKILFPGNPALLIIDAGACEGEDSIRYSRLFPASQIYAFEPLPGNIELAKNSFVKYAINNVRLIAKAISDTNGSASFFVSSGQPPGIIGGDWDFGNKSSSLLAPARHTEVTGFVKFDKTEIVETITLDKFCDQYSISSIDLIHLDVQGGEMKVLKGAERCLHNVKAIWLEVSTIDLYKDQPLAIDIEKFMKKNGFAMVKDNLHKFTGERLYISKLFYPKYRTMFPVWARKKSLFQKMLRQIRL